MNQLISFLTTTLLRNIAGVAVEESGSLRNSLEVTKSLSDKHLDLLRPSARYYSVFKGMNSIKLITCSIGDFFDLCL